MLFRSVAFFGIGAYTSALVSLGFEVHEGTMESFGDDRRVDAVAIWEPHAQNSLDALGSDAIDIQDASVYRERFNLNTTTNVLRDPDKRRTLVEFLRAITRASDLARRQPAQARTLLAPFINTPATTIAHVWNRFSFPANLPRDLPDVLGNVEIFVAAVQFRQPRPKAALTGLIDSSLLTASKR